MKFCWSGNEVLIILFCRLQQKYFDLNLSNKFLKSHWNHQILLKLYIIQVLMNVP